MVQLQDTAFCYFYIYIKLGCLHFYFVELSKLRMYEFYYDFLVKELDEGAVTLMHSDTDSFLIHVKQHMDDILWKNRILFDFSSLPDHHQLKDDSNREVKYVV